MNLRSEPVPQNICAKDAVAHDHDGADQRKQGAGGQTAAVKTAAKYPEEKDQRGIITQQHGNLLRMAVNSKGEDGRRHGQDDSPGKTGAEDQAQGHDQQHHARSTLGNAAKGIQHKTVRDIRQTVGIAQAQQMLQRREDIEEPEKTYRRRDGKMRIPVLQVEDVRPVLPARAPAGTPVWPQNVPGMLLTELFWHASLQRYR